MDHKQRIETLKVVQREMNRLRVDYPNGKWFRLQDFIKDEIKFLEKEVKRK